MNNSSPLLHKIPDACQRLQICRSALYQLIRSGELKVVKFGISTRIPEFELQKLITARIEVSHDIRH
ncbi:excisionase family DNA binding protein [Lysobacter niabensis]|uniref:Excisionase family DNA binding protein n=1 Tax=Agrilutibacter niabensis TaxID=380628 RepID=A0ABU1VMA3_9GAMM|nr:helix-turn-helix domain-containing protein [Lysobacter niabensis]MDR7098613.1 excisionase family DNA binding protein [Lysobacter niabensis]